MDAAKSTERRNENHSSILFGPPYTTGFTVARKRIWKSYGLLSILIMLNVVWLLGVPDDTLDTLDVFSLHDDVTKWDIPCYWSFVWGIHRSPVNSPHKGQWLGALIFVFICAWKMVEKTKKGRWFDMPSRSLLRHCNGSHISCTAC